MQSIPSWPPLRSVSVPEAQVIVNRTSRGTTRVSVTKELNAGFPDQVRGVGGGSECTASVDFVSGATVNSRGRHPWGEARWPPRSGDPISIDMGHDGAMARQLTGYVDSSAGSFSGREVSVTAVDTVDQLRKRITVEPLLAAMPPLGELDTRYNYRYIGLSGTFFTDMFLRSCGYNATPPRNRGCILSVPLMGSLWPEVGSCYKASGATDQNPLFYATPWGLGLADGDANYTPWFGPSGASGKLDQTLQITFMVHPNIPAGTDPAGVTVRWRTGVGGKTGEQIIRLRVQAGRAIYLQSLSGGVFTDVCSLPASQAATATTFTARILRGGGCSINADNGAYVSGKFAPSAIMRDEPIDSIGVNAPGSGGGLIGAAQVAFTEDRQWHHVPTADLTHTYQWRSLSASPLIDNEMVLDLLNEQAQAEGAAWWLDEQGKLVWRNRARLTGATPTLTLTARRHIKDIKWRTSPDSVYSKIEVTNKAPMISIGPNYHIDAYQGSGRELEEGETYEEIIEAGPSEDWIMVDDTATELGSAGAGTGDVFNRGYGTWVGSTRVKDGVGSQSDSEILANWATNNRLTRLGPEKFLYRATVPAGAITSTERIHLRTPGDGYTTAFWPKRRGYNLPVVRCKARVEWTEQSRTADAQGPAYAPVFEHDAGWWVQSESALNEIADWLAAQLTAPTPIITGVELAAVEHRLQVGDVVWVQDDAMTGTQLLVLVTKVVIEQVGEAKQHMSIGCMVLDVYEFESTYDQVDFFNASDTYGRVDTAHAAQTYGQVDLRPFGF